MGEINSAIRRFERFLSNHGGYYNNCTEVRSDTKGALSDEIQMSENRRRYQKVAVNENETIPIGIFLYDFDKKTEKFFRYKSRGKK